LKISICLTTYKKLDILKKVLVELQKLTYPFELVISDDCSGREMENYLVNEVPDMFPDYKIALGAINRGCSESLDRSLMQASGDILIHMDPDIILNTVDPYVRMMNWHQVFADYLVKYPEIGILAPDYPFHHLRLWRDGYDEVDYCMGGIFSLRRNTFDKVKNFLGRGLWDKNLSLGQVEMDMNYRARMCGYRTAMIQEVQWIHLDPNPNWQGHRGVIEFLKKWNMYLLGFFNYKSPAMLIWDEFPLNRLLRKQIFCQEQLNKSPEHLVVQAHDCEVIKELKAPGSWREEELRELVIRNKVFKGCDEFESISEDLLKGKIKWNLEIEEELNKKRRK